jgi:hypothetical protein
MKKNNILREENIARLFCYKASGGVDELKD